MTYFVIFYHNYRIALQLAGIEDNNVQNVRLCRHEE